MIKKRILAIILLLCCFLSSMPISKVMAETTDQKELTINEMAEGLKSVGMITGNSKGDLMLQSQLKRSEATQFIVNLLGKNKYVQENKASYSDTGFKDVKTTDWFAGCAGFCLQSTIISMNETSTFRPRDYVSEKEFLTMVMRALGYTSDDYTWNTVFQKAYEINLVNDSSYQTKTLDNRNFKRSDVVKVMFTALRLKPKDENKTLVQKMVESELLTYDKAIASKILEDLTVSKIINIKALNEQKLKIIFNENIGDVKLENVKIYETTNKSKELSAISIDKSGATLNIKTSPQLTKKSYTIEISKVQDIDGNIIPLVTSSFTAYSAESLVSDLFIVSSIEQKDDNEINVYFTHPINQNALNPAYYEVYENSVLFSATAGDLSIKLLPKNKGVNITFKGKKFTKDQEYTVKVSQDLMSSYGVYYSGQEELPSIIAKSIDDTGFIITQVTTLSNKTIQVDFSMDLDTDFAQQIYMYSLTDTNNKQIQITNAQIGSKSVILTINGNIDSSKNYNLMVNYMTDSTSQYTIKKQTQTFSGYWVQPVEFMVNNVTPTDSGTLVLSFSRPLNAKSAVDILNYALIDSKNPSQLVYPKKVLFSEENPYEVKLFISKDNRIQVDRTYTVRVMSKLTDYTGGTLGSQTDVTFDSYDIPTAKVIPERAVLISQDTLKVPFSREISLDSPNVFTDNYSLEYYDNGTLIKKIPIAITYIDNLTIVLKFDKLDDKVQYTFSYKEIKDYAGDSYTDQATNMVQVTKGK